MSLVSYKPIFTIRRSKALEELPREELIKLLPPSMQEEVERVEWVFKNLSKIADKEIRDYVTGEPIDGRLLTKEELLLLFDPEPVEYENLSKEENNLLYISSDPVLWCRVYLKMNPRVYQILVLREEKPRVVLRWGRRGGKSTTMALRILWRSQTRPGNKSILVAPMLSHVEVTWNMLVELVQRDEEMKQLWDERKIKNKKQPNHEMTFPNGSRVLGFTSGMRSNNNADNVRGQEGDDLYCDEIDYMNAGDLKALLAIVRDTGRGKKYMYVSSTPSGRRDMMYRFCVEFPRKHPELYKEYYFPSHCDINYSQVNDQEFKMVYTHNQYLHEIIADFGEEATGVFLQSHIDRALSHYPSGYKYERAGLLYKPKGVKRVVGVDWDKVGAGVNIVISDIDLYNDKDPEDPDSGRVKIIARFEVPRGEYTLTEGKELIKRIYMTYNPDLLVLDRGYGEDQYEDLSLAAINDHRLAGLKQIIRPFYFHQNIEIWDPITRTTEKKEAKDYMVNLVTKLFEDDSIILNKSDKQEAGTIIDLTSQFEGYVVAGVSNYGKPKYEASNVEVGDHALDAFMLTILGAYTEWGDFSRARKAPHPVAVSFDPRKSIKNVAESDKDFSLEDASDIRYIRRSMWKNKGRTDIVRKRSIKRSSF